jgi:hypothetical protein
LTAAFVLLFLISLQLSAELTRVEARMQRLAEELTLARLDAGPRAARPAGTDTPAGGESKPVG